MVNELLSLVELIIQLYKKIKVICPSSVAKFFAFIIISTVSYSNYHNLRRFNCYKTLNTPFNFFIIIPYLLQKSSLYNFCLN